MELKKQDQKLERKKLDEKWDKNRLRFLRIN